MTEFWKRVAHRARSDGPQQFIGRAIRYIISNPLVLAEPLYQLLKPSWTTLTLGDIECRFTLEPGMISAHDFRGDFESEKEVITELLGDIEEDDVFWDVGANVGLYTCFVSSSLSNSQAAIAFEPHPGVRSYLTRNVEKNTPNTQILPYGLGATETTQELSEVGVTGHTIANTHDHDTVKIEVTTAQSVINEHEIPAPTVVKMDIEGAELQALEGFRPLLDQVRLLYCEVHPKMLAQMNASSDEVKTLLLDSGFEIDRLDTRGGTYFLRCERTTS
jgi:FkbM family methyltransferase